MSTLRGTVGFKGARGFSAYEIAVQNGFEGTEQDWLATLGTAQHYDRVLTTYKVTSSQTTFNLDAKLTKTSIVDVFVNGLRKANDTYTINTTTKQIVFKTALVSNDLLEVYMTSMSTSELPIVTTITSESTDDTTPSTKAVYNHVDNEVTKVKNDLKTITNDINDVNTTLTTKIAKTDIAVVTGSKANIASGTTEIVDINYPDGFNQANTVIIGKMISSNNNYYDTADSELTTSGFPIIEMIALMSTGIRIWLKNTNSTAARAGHYKITLMKV
jgi:hypothetical protein